MTKKIAIYSGVTPSTTFIENLIEAVADEGFVVYLFGYSKTPKKYRNPKIKVYNYPRNRWKIIPYVFISRIKLALISFERYKKLSKHIQSKKQKFKQSWMLWSIYADVVIHLPDIFHIQWARNLDEWMFLKELFGVKIVLSLRGTQVNIAPLASKELASLYLKNFPKVDGFHAVSKNIAETAIYYGADPGSTHVIYSGINLRSIRNSEKKLAFNNDEELQLLSIGRMKWIKGYQLALDALKILKESGVRFHYTIIAGGDAEELLYQISDLQLNSCITIIPGLPQKEVFLRMQTSDLLLLTSYDEGIANVSLEAMAVGLPVLSSNCGGMQEVINHNETGYLFSNRDINDLCEKILMFINLDPEDKRKVCAKAQKYVISNHPVELLGSKMKDLYNEVEIKAL